MKRRYHYPKHLPQNSRFGRIIIYPKDVQCITDKSEHYGRTMLRKVKDHCQKESHQVVTIDEFCEYTGIASTS